MNEWMNEWMNEHIHFYLNNYITWKMNTKYNMNSVFVKEFHMYPPHTINDNDMLFYSLTTMMCFLTKEWYGFPAYTINLFLKAYHKITYKEDLKII